MGRNKVENKKKIRSIRLYDIDNQALVAFFETRQIAIDSLVKIINEYPKQVKQILERIKTKQTKDAKNETVSNYRGNAESK
jgi:hypothetical protein